MEGEPADLRVAAVDVEQPLALPRAYIREGVKLGQEKVPQPTDLLGGQHVGDEEEAVLFKLLDLFAGAPGTLPSFPRGWVRARGSAGAAGQPAPRAQQPKRLGVADPGLAAP